ncbi:S8 family serine peptidase [Ornithinimicrobium panacihumi]|uniref:S8 family serine peptidase n=1 Tax=Ornithinimicrobium panacihumi TaxID=2008449 RepID=UPI003F8C8849
MTATSLAFAGLGTAVTATAVPGPFPTDETSLAEKIDAAVTAQLEEEGRADVWVRLADRPDLDKYSSISDWDERGQAVVDALTDTAEESQKELRSQLDAQGVEYQAFWATNSLRVSGADAELLTSMASDSEVEGVYPTMQIEIPELEPEAPEMAPAAVEWGIADVKAPEVWDDLGVDGQGIVVASIDTGAQYDHPALVNQYRGNNGDGTFDHNYNWFNAAGGSPDQPADNNGHGSHVTGTMVGDDGGDNQIGMAPGAKWISADGCCPTDAALIESGQWMLEPRDLNGENPDVTKRPHIINNSWGTQAPSTAPFMEDIIEAWAASGQFGVFANGNTGPNCASAGSPGSRTVTYAVGNYRSDHTIATSSGRGPGQDGHTNPNIAAPGTSVRSSVPGNGYASYSGTSMASPHVAGAVALVWSASPALVGDVEGTRALLNGSAVDTEDLQCGGTAENNNVFGEGRLDALALVSSAPAGETGTLVGTVTDGASGEALSGVNLAVEGPIERDVVSDEDGTYSVLLTAGEYTVTASKFGYAQKTVNAAITPEQTTTLDIAMDPVPSSTVTGTVTDGSGYGFPLYARVSANGTPAATYTDPETGVFSIDLPEGQAFELTVQVQYPGYTAPTVEVTAGDGVTADVQVPVDAATCSAPGYGWDVNGVTESFDAEALPEGWEVVDHAGTGGVWAFDNPGGRDNLTGGEGNMAIMDSDHYGSGAEQDTSLVTPSVDMSALESPVVGFKQDWRALGDNADVDVSIDGGQTWSTVLAQTTSLRGPDEQILPLPDAAGQADVKVRFHQYNADYDYWWQVDDVFLGNRACAPTGEGGYVVGTVAGDETGEGVVGATVTNLDVPEEKAVTTATPNDPGLDDGFYWIFSSHPGTHPFEAAARGYENKTQDLTVTHGDTVRGDFVLGSPFIVVDPTEIYSAVTLGGERTHTLTISNTGTGEAQVELSEVAGDFTILRADGSKSRMGKSAARDGGEVVSIEAPTSLEAFGGSSMASQGTPDEVRAAADPWTPLGNYPRPAMDNRVVNLDGDWYTIGGTDGTAAFADVNRYDAASATWTAVAPLPTAASAVTAGAVAGEIVVSGGWVANGVSGATAVYDAGSDSWTTGADNPVPVSAAGAAVLDGKLYSVGGCTTTSCSPMSASVTAYDPAADAWEQLADYPQAVAFASCGGVDGQLVCTGGNPGTGGVASSYSYDPAADAWTPLPDAPVDSWASQYATANGQLVVNGGVQGGEITNASFAFDGAAGEWVQMPASSSALYRGGAACGIAKVGGAVSNFDAVPTAEHLPGYDDCGGSGADVDWLTVDPMELTIPAGESASVEVVTDGDVAQPGTYTAGIKVKANSPQRLDTIPVTMVVSPPKNWGKLMGTVSGTDGKSTDPIQGAVVDITPTKGNGAGWALITDEAGRYAHWMVAGKYDTIAAKDGFRPQAKQAQVKKGKDTVVNYTLRKIG